MGAGPVQPEPVAPDTEEAGLLERAADEVSEQASRTVRFVGRLGSAFGEGMSDARDEHRS